MLQKRKMFIEELYRRFVGGTYLVISYILDKEIYYATKI